MSDTALRLADEIDGDRYGDVAAELRRLVAENKALKADAERYRWLRESGSIAANPTGRGVCLPLYTMDEWNRKELDAAIDAVRSKA